MNNASKIIIVLAAIAILFIIVITYSGPGSILSDNTSQVHNDGKYGIGTDKESISDFGGNKSNNVKVTINDVQILAYLAITQEQQTKGLSIMDNITDDEGMLFVFESEGIHDSFWMKDMKFPLDIIWIDMDQTIVHIEKNLQPCNAIVGCPLYGPQQNVKYVLEINAGLSEKYDMENGDRIKIDPFV